MEDTNLNMKKENNEISLDLQKKTLLDLRKEDAEMALTAENNNDSDTQSNLRCTKCRFSPIIEYATHFSFVRWGFSFMFCIIFILGTILLLRSSIGLEIAKFLKSIFNDPLIQ